MRALSPKVSADLPHHQDTKGRNLAALAASGDRFRMPLDKCVLRCDKYMKLIVGGTYGLTRFHDDGTRKFHGGVDLCAPIGTDCYAIYRGRVLETPIGKDFGHYVLARFDLPEGRRFAIYAHLSKILVAAGAKLDAGVVLGKTGATGNSSRDYPHLHFEIWTSLKARTEKDRAKYRVNPLDVLGPLPFEPFAVEVLDGARRA
jgi:murein DD-endopeptidase MepM/ murein hydrolase activator NlpD